MFKSIKQFDLEIHDVEQRMAALHGEITTLEEATEPTEEQQSRLTAAGEEFEAARNQRDLLKRQRARQVEINETTSSITDPNSIPRDPQHEAQYDPRIPRAPEAKREFESIGQWAYTAIHSPSDQRLNFHAAEHQEMANDERGGFLVPDIFRPQLLSVTPQEAIIRPRATVFPPDSRHPDAKVEMPALDQTATGGGDHRMYGGVEVDWIAEGETKPATTALFRLVEWTPFEVAASMNVTDKVLRNVAMLESFLLNQMRLALLANEDTQFYSGGGSTRPTGFIDHDSRYVVPRGGANAITYEDVVNMLSRFWGDGGVWITSHSTIPELTTIQDANGNAMWQNSAREGMPPMLMGKPVLFSQRANLLGDEGDLALADLTKYVIQDGSGPFLGVGFVNDDFRRNRRTLKIFRNVDGKPWLTEPITTENGWEQSPFVVLGDAVG